jgi:hypothetical protein
VSVPVGAAGRFRAGELAAQFAVFERTAARPAVVTACGG